MACNSNNICSYGIKEQKRKQSKSLSLLPHFHEAWPQQNQPLQQDTLSYEQSFPNQPQPTPSPTSSTTSFPTLLSLLLETKKQGENNAISSVLQANPYDNTYNNQYNSQYNYQYQNQYNNQIAPHISNQAASSPITGSSTEQHLHLQYQQQNVYYGNRQNYLPHNGYSRNFNILPIIRTTTTQNLVSSVIKLSQKASQQCNNIYTTQEYAAQQNYANHNSKQQTEIAANDQVSPVVKPLQEASQQYNTYTTQEYVAEQNYEDNNSKQQQQVSQQDTAYATQQYITQQSYASNNTEQQNHISSGDPKSKHERIQHYPWMKFKHLG